MTAGDDDGTEDTALLERSCAALMEHFDSVQIVATRKLSGGDTARCASGRGSYYERLGATSDWVMCQQAANRAVAAQRAVREEDE